jgi:hypothetical protein
MPIDDGKISPTDVSKVMTRFLEANAIDAVGKSIS